MWIGCVCGCDQDGDKCNVCPAGSYCTAGQASLCAKGRFSATPAAPCEACSRGRYQSSKGATACDEYGAGQYIASNAASACEACTPGRHSPAIGSPCVKCAPGRFQSGERATACNECTGERTICLAGSSSSLQQCCDSAAVAKGGNTRCECGSGFFALPAVLGDEVIDGRHWWSDPAVWPTADAFCKAAPVGPEQPICQRCPEQVPDCGKDGRRWDNIPLPAGLWQDRGHFKIMAGLPSSLLSAAHRAGIQSPPQLVSKQEVDGALKPFYFEACDGPAHCSMFSLAHPQAS